MLGNLETEVAHFRRRVAPRAGVGGLQEVECRGHRRAIDIVAKRAATCCGRSVKRALNLAVLEQAFSSTPYAHLAAWPCLAWRRCPTGTTSVCRWPPLRAGSDRGWPPNVASRIVGPLGAPRHRRSKGELAASLRPAQQVYAAAGSSGASHWTPFRETATQLKAIVWQHRATGISMSDAVDGCCFLQVEQDGRGRTPASYRGGIIDGIRVQRVGARQVKLFPKLVSGRKPLTVMEESRARKRTSGRKGTQRTRKKR